MSNKLNWEEISFTIIAYSGEGKGHAFNAIEQAREGKITEAFDLIEKAEQSCLVAEKAHMEVITQEAQGINIEFKVIFMHAEDQLLTTQSIILIAKEIIRLYERLNKYEK